MIALHAIDATPSLFTQEPHNGEPPMRTHAASCVLGSKVYVFGGLGAGASNQLWALDTILHRWERLLPPGPKPPARSAATLAGDDDAHAVYLFGGLGRVKRDYLKTRDGVPGATLRTQLHAQRSMFSDVWRFDGTAKRWEELTFIHMCPAPRRGHTATYCSGRVLVEEPEETSVDGTEATSFTEATSADGTEARSLVEEGALLPKYMVVVGGAVPDPKGFEHIAGTPVWALDLNRRKWLHLPTTGYAEAAHRFEHTTTRLGERLFVVGGMTMPLCDGQDWRPPQGNDLVFGAMRWGRVVDDVACLDLETLVWSRLDVDGPPLAVRGHAACESPLRPGELLVVGGRAPASSKKLEQDSRIEFFDDEVDVDDGTLKVRALRVDDPVPKFRILPAAGQAPPDSYGHVCVGWRADALSFEKLRRDRGEELEKHAVAVPGGAAREAPARKKKKKKKRGQKEKPPPRGLQGVLGNALCLERACLLCYGGATSDASYGPLALHLFDMAWGPPPDSEDEDAAGDAWRRPTTPEGPATPQFSPIKEDALRGVQGSRCGSPDLFRPSTGSSHGSRAERRRAEQDRRFFVEQLEKHGGQLPESYALMKAVVEQRAPGLRTSRLRPGMKAPADPPWQRAQTAPLLQLPGARMSLGSRPGSRASSRPASRPGSRRPSSTTRPRASAGDRPPTSGSARALAPRPSTTQTVRTVGRATLGRGSLLGVGRRTLAELPDANTTIWRARDIFRVNVEATEEHAFQTMREATLGRPRTAF